MENEELVKAAIERILDDSNIVWPRYGSETTEQLAQKIVAKIKQIEKN